MKSFRSDYLQFCSAAVTFFILGSQLPFTFKQPKDFLELSYNLLRSYVLSLWLLDQKSNLPEDIKNWIVASTINLLSVVGNFFFPKIPLSISLILLIRVNLWLEKWVQWKKKKKRSHSYIKSLLHLESYANICVP